MRGQAEHSRVKENATQYEEKDPGLFPLLGSKSEMVCTVSPQHCKGSLLGIWLTQEKRPSSSDGWGIPQPCCPGRSPYSEAPRKQVIRTHREVPVSLSVTHSWLWEITRDCQIFAGGFLIKAENKFRGDRNNAEVQESNIFRKVKEANCTYFLKNDQQTMNKGTIKSCLGN